VRERQQHQFQERQVVCHRQHMRGIGALRAASLEPTALGTPLQQDVKEPRPDLILQQPRAKFAQHRSVKAVIVEWQSEQIFSVQAAAHRIGSLRIAQLFGKLQDADQHQLPRRIGGRPGRGREIGAGLIVMQTGQLVAQLQPRMPLRKALRATRAVSAGTSGNG
jgi:hypothetical protein